MTAKRKQQVKQAWDIGKLIGLISAGLLVVQQGMEIRAKQASDSATLARTVAAMQGDIAKIVSVSKSVPKLDRRVRGIERRLHIETPYGPPMPADSLEARSGRASSPISILTAPLRGLWRMIRGGGS